MRLDAQRLLKVGRPLIEIFADPDLTSEVTELPRLNSGSKTNDSRYWLPHSGNDKFFALGGSLDNLRETRLGIAEGDGGFHRDMQLV